jgi:osmotically-inducible protein OsmY
MTTLSHTTTANCPFAEGSPDEQLRHRVCLFLQTLRLAIARRLQIDVQNGAVIVEGIARSYYERQMAVACVKRVAGVRQVIDRIVVHDDPERVGHAAPAGGGCVLKL